MSSVIKATLVALAWFLLSSSAHAFVLKNHPPENYLDGTSTIGVDGVISDSSGNLEPYYQVIGNLSGKSLVTIGWWGAFSGGDPLNGVLSVYLGKSFATALKIATGADIVETALTPDLNNVVPFLYEVVFNPALLLTENDTHLFIWYTGEDANWTWLFREGWNATNGLTAFILSGTDPQSVPEPGVLALLGLAALALPLVRRRRV